MVLIKPPWRESYPVSVLYGTLKAVLVSPAELVAYLLGLVMPEVKNRKYRAESFVLWNTDSKFSKKFIPTPIHFYSFHGEQPESLNYLAQVPTEQKIRLYKLGTVTHEVAHHVYDYLMDADKRAQWRELVDRTQAITAYVKSYTEHKLKYDEFFTEAVRLKTTAPDYLKTNFPEIDQFLTDNFPSIKDDNDKK